VEINKQADQDRQQFYQLANDLSNRVARLESLLRRIKLDMATWIVSD
jgi:hypothetical protein